MTSRPLHLAAAGVGISWHGEAQVRGPGLVADWPGMPRVGILPKEAAWWGVVATAVLGERERWLPVGWAGLRTTGEARRNASGQRQPGRLCARSV